MFNPRKMLQFWGRMLCWAVPIASGLLLLLLLALSARSEWADWQLILGLAAGIIPSGLSIMAAFAISIAFTQKLYAVKDRRAAFGFLLHRLFGQASFKPWMILEEGRINTELTKPDSLLLRLGGPGNLVIRKDTAAVLERAGRLTRVVGPGFPHLEPFERVYDTVDLRPIRWVHAVSALSKEGIPVTCEADITFQIQAGNQEATADNPYPMSPDAVLAAVTNKWIRESSRPAADQVLDWKSLIVVSTTEGTLRFILARYPLDRLIHPEKEGEEHPRQVIRRQLETELQDAAPRVGARILKVELGKISVADAVTQQWVESWRANWDRWESEYLAVAQADYLEAVGEAQSELIAEKICSTANVLHGLAVQNRQAFVTAALAELYLAMRDINPDSLALTYLPSEATRMLQASAGLTLGPGAGNTGSPAA